MKEKKWVDFQISNDDRGTSITVGLYDYSVQYIRTYYARCLRGRAESKDGIG